MLTFRDPDIEKELNLGGLHPKAAAWIFEDLTRYLDKPLEDIAKEYWHYRTSEDLERQAQVGRATSAQEVNEYYRQTPHYLYELSYWEASLDKQAWFDVVRRACKRFKLCSVLDFGGGVGGVSLALAKDGIACAHLDIPGKTSAYAQWRFNRHNHAVPFINALEPWPDQRYDAVIAWDVLEHIFDLEQTIARIGESLRPGGWLMSKSTFAPDDGGHHEEIHLAKHAHYHDIQRFNRMIEERGLRFKGQLKPDRISRLLRQMGNPYAVAGIRLAAKLKHGDNFLIHERAAA